MLVFGTFSFQCARYGQPASVWNLLRLSCKTRNSSSLEPGTFVFKHCLAEDREDLQNWEFNKQVLQGRLLPAIRTLDLVDSRFATFSV